MGKCFICRTVCKKVPRCNQTDQLLDNEVVIFILQKLLDISSAVCVDIISSNGNPSTWLSFCNLCASFLQETQAIFSKATYFRKKFEKAKMELKNNIQTSHKDRELASEKYLKNRNKVHIPDYFLSLYFKGNCESDDVAAFDSIIVKKEEYLEDYNLSEDHDEKEKVQNDRFNENDGASDYENVFDPPETELKDEDKNINENQSSDNEAGSVKQYQLSQQNDEPLNDPEQFTTENSRKFHCIYCDYTSNRRVSWIVHTRRHHTKETPYSCELCCAKFFGRKDVCNHFKTAHPGKKPTPIIKSTSAKSKNKRSRVRKKPTSSEFVCNLCGRDCGDKSTFETHMNYHKKEKTIMCDLCSEKFFNITMLRWHQRSIHYKELNLEPFQCKECGKMFGGPRGLESHIVSQHTKKFDFICENCGAGFIDKGKLVYHMRMQHNLEKPYECPICFEKLACKRRVSEHIQTHTGKYEHICTMCEKGFTSAAYLRRHLKYHSSEFPHKRKSRLASKVKNPMPPTEDLPTLENPILPLPISIQQRAKCGLRKYPSSKKSRYDY